MEETNTHIIYSNVADIPSNWDEIGCTNVFLSKDYLKVLEVSKPHNMTCHYVGFYHDEVLIGKALSQFLDLTPINPYNRKASVITCTVKKWLIDAFISKVLFIGNNMLTGQNAYYFTSTIPVAQIANLMHQAGIALEQVFKKQGKSVHITVYKDFEKQTLEGLVKNRFQSYYPFSIQPNMIFQVKENWKSIDDYVGNLSKKYRDQFKRARKKSVGITQHKFTLEDLEKHQDRIFELYQNVANNAPFNTFYLSEHHFTCFKKCLNEHFRFYGYFKEGNLIGFNTLIRNGSDFDTYFLGYDEEFQREHLLYLNMLYDMIGYAIKKRFNRVIFARTALEIKSSVGAEPVEMFGLIKHHNPLIHFFIARLFTYFEPKVEWNQRHPFIG